MSGPIAVGVDVVDVDRIRTVMGRTPALLERVYTPGELAYCNAATDPAERLAARWAAKEAAVKCLGGGVPGLDLQEIEIVRGADGAPSLVVVGEAATRAAERGIGTWLVSLSHTSALAQAVVIASE